MALGPCVKCKRFARFGEACPFCGGDVAPNGWRAAARLSRAAAIAVVASACTNSLPPPTNVDPPAADADLTVLDPIPAPTPMYGAAPPPTVIPEPTATMAPMYGLAPRLPN